MSDTEHVISPSTMVGQYNDTLPTYTNNQSSVVQTDNRGRLLAVISNPATAPVIVSGAAYVSSASFNRTNDTNAYAANDVVGPATGSTAAQTFASIGPAAGGEVILTTVQLEIDISAIPSGMTSFLLYLYNVTPPSALGDNTAFDLPSGDRASFLGYVPLGAPADLGATLYVETLQVNKQITVPSGGSLFGYLVTVGAYTPAASSTFKITLHAAGF